MVHNRPEAIERRRKLRKEIHNKLKDTKFPKYKIRTCNGCGKRKRCQWYYSFNLGGEPQYRTRCKDCYKKYISKNSQTKKYKSSRSKKRKEQGNKKKEKAIKFLGGKCKKCGYNQCIGALTFHHRDPDEKEFQISHYFESSWENIKKELKKCDLMCFNCHMELHYKED